MTKQDEQPTTGSWFDCIPDSWAQGTPHGTRPGGKTGVFFSHGPDPYTPQMPQTPGQFGLLVVPTKGHHK